MQYTLKWDGGNVRGFSGIAFGVKTVSTVYKENGEIYITELKRVYKAISSQCYLV